MTITQRMMLAGMKTFPAVLTLGALALWYVGRREAALVERAREAGL